MNKNMSLGDHEDSNSTMLLDNNQHLYKMGSVNDFTNLNGGHVIHFLQRSSNNMMLVTPNSIGDYSQIPDVIMSEDEERGNKSEDTVELDIDRFHICYAEGKVEEVNKTFDTDEIIDDIFENMKQSDDHVQTNHIQSEFSLDLDEEDECAVEIENDNEMEEVFVDVETEQNNEINETDDDNISIDEVDVPTPPTPDANDVEQNETDDEIMDENEKTDITPDTVVEINIPSPPCIMSRMEYVNNYEDSSSSTHKINSPFSADVESHIYDDNTYSTIDAPTIPIDEMEEERNNDDHKINEIASHLITNGNINETRITEIQVQDINQILIQSKEDINAVSMFKEKGSNQVLMQTKEQNANQPETCKQPAFKICKVIHHADGTRECIETNINEISLADRAVVYRAMFSKFPQALTQNGTDKEKAENVVKDTEKEKAAAVNNKTIENNLEQQPSTSLQKIDTLPPATDTNYPLKTFLKTSSDDLPVNSQNLVTVKQVNLKSVIQNCDSNISNVKLGDKYQKTTPKTLSLNTVKLKSTSSSFKSKTNFETESSTHNCKAEKYFDCNGCNERFKSDTDFLSHAALNYLKVSPHLFADNCIIKCTLCKEKPVLMADLMMAKEHLRTHCTEISTKCDLCTQVVARDHIYATKENVEVLSERNFESNEMNNNEDEEMILVGETDMIADEENANKNDDILVEKDDLLPSKKTPALIYKCRYCEKQFRKRNICKMHVFAHLDLHPITCPLCGIAFHRKELLNEHMQSHVLAKAIKGKDDGKNETKKENNIITIKESRNIEVITLDENKTSEIPKSPIKKRQIDDKTVKSSLDNCPILCKMCGVEFKTTHRLRIHQTRLHKNQIANSDAKTTTKVVSQDCGKECQNNNALVQHMQNACVTDILCGLCGKMVPSGRGYTNHKYYCHRKSIESQTKTQRTKTPAVNNTIPQVLDHIEVVNNKPEACTITEIVDQTETAKNANSTNVVESPALATATKTNVQQKCYHCAYATSNMNNLRTHLVKKHKYPTFRSRQNKNEPITCDKCGLSCKGTSALKLHKTRFCLAGQTLVCNICSKTFKERRKYTAHKSTHKPVGQKRGRPKKTEEINIDDTDAGSGSKSDNQSLQLAIRSIDETDDPQKNKTEKSKIVIEEINTYEDEPQKANETLMVSGVQPVTQLRGNNTEMKGQVVHLVVRNSNAIQSSNGLIHQPIRQAPISNQPNQVLNCYQVLIAPTGERVLALMPNFSFNS